MLASLIQYIAFLLSFITFCVAVLGGIAAVHYGRLALMDRTKAEHEKQQRRQNPNIIPLNPNAIEHTIKRWHYGPDTRRDRR